MATTAQFIQFGPILNAGVLETGIKIYHYAAGTTTDQDMWTTRAKAATVAQPLVADANGIASAYGDGLYKFVIKDSDDTTLYTYDNVQVLDPQAAVTGEGAALASASTLVLGSDGDQFHVTGSTGITALSGSQASVLLVFDSTPTLTHSASLILLGSVNVTAAAGDWMRFMNEGSNVWREIGRGSSDQLQLTGEVNVGPSTGGYFDVGADAYDFPCDFRLTLATGTPVTTSDQTAKTILYLAPYKGNRIALYDTTAAKWLTIHSAEVNLTPTLSASKPFDVFCYNSSGTPTLEVLAWTDDTTRATALTTQDGVYVKTGDASRRYLGTIYANSSSQMTDSAANRHLWNYYNRVRKTLLVVEGTDSWSYTLLTWRQANGSTANQFDIVIGVAEDPVEVVAQVTSSSSSSTSRCPGIGIDATDTNSAQILSGPHATSMTVVDQAHYYGWPSVGQHTIAWLEISVASGTTTWFGDNGVTYIQSGMRGVFFC